MPGEERPRRRDYEKVLSSLESRWRRRPRADRGRMMQEILDALWEAFEGRAYSWCGFHLPDADGRLAPGPRRGETPSGDGRDARDKAVSTRQTHVVPERGPAERSTIAVPVLDMGGTVFAVLEASSSPSSKFDDEDRRWLERIVKELGEAPPPAAPS